MAGREGRRSHAMPERWLSLIASDPSHELRIVRAEGAHVWDDASRRYIDLVTGGGVTVLGHAHPRFLAALQSQLQTLTSVHADFGHDAQEEFVEALSVAMPVGLSSVMITNSGSEAVDAAVRMALATTRRSRLVATVGAFHGTTFLGTALSDHRSAARTARAEVTRVPYDDVAAMERALDRQVAAVIVEPMQWGAVAREPSPSYLADVAALCKAAGCLLIVDEVQTALRTWPALLSARTQLHADIVCLGSSIANGFPIGAAVVTDRVHTAAAGSVRGGTVAGNPLACAAGAATLRALSDPPMRTRINDSGHLLQSRLRALRITQIRRVVGEGTLASVELHTDPAGVARAMRAHGLLARLSLSGEIRVMPPSVIDRKLVGEIVEGLAAAILDSRQSRRRRRPAEAPAVELRGVAARPRGRASRAS